MDSRERFTATVGDYRRYRPDYPSALFDWIMLDGGLGPGDTVVDCGCGTGIATRQLAARGLSTIGVDPNQAMLDAARESAPTLVWRIGDAETLPVTDSDPPIAAIVFAQALHWVDLDRALPRFSEVLRPGGRVVALWNLRNPDVPLMAAYDALLCEHCPEYIRVGAEPRARAIMERDDLIGARFHRVPHHQVLDREGFIGRVWSSSYVKHGLINRPVFESELSRLFQRFESEGLVRFDYDATAISFEPPSTF